MMAMGWLLLAATSQFAPGGPEVEPAVEPAVALESPAHWVTADDYPPEAVANTEHGTTAIRYRVQPDGTVSDCEIVTSSGSPRLDAATCALIVARARYSPARDGAGNAIASQKTLRFTWKLPAVEKPVDMTYAIDIAADGRVLGCRIIALKGDARQRPCGNTLVGSTMPPALNSDGEPYAARITVKYSLAIAKLAPADIHAAAPAAAVPMSGAAAPR